MSLVKGYHARQINHANNACIGLDTDIAANQIQKQLNNELAQ